MSKYKNMHMAGHFWIAEMWARQRAETESYLWHLMTILTSLIVNDKVIMVEKISQQKWFKQLQ